MTIIQDYDPSFTRDGIGLSIGVFDGVHIGHQSILQRLYDWGQVSQLPTAVLTFEPSPAELLKPNLAPPKLTQSSQKIEILQSFGISEVFILRFNREISNMSATDFISGILADQLRVQHVVIGYDWHFGKNRGGTIATLEKYGKKYGFGVSVVEQRQIDGQSVHSTRIRSAIAEGNLELAKKMLTRPHTLRGRVISGDQRGRHIGFPTANIDAGRQVLPPSGVYATSVTLKNSNSERPTIYESVTNIGIQPTFGRNTSKIEVHILDFNQEIYGKELDVVFREKIRSEMEFPDIQCLAQQIREDIKVARSILKDSCFV